ncbi:preprotein translocase subunit YajC [bacterium]|nr:preprotein translocase subunit YajC [bacterium]
MTLLFLFQSSPGGGSGLGFILPMVLIFAIMYFLIFRPQAKKQKQHQAMISALKKGDKIVTAGGLYGTIAGIKESEKTLIVKIAENVKVEITRSSVARVRDKEDGAT